MSFSSLWKSQSVRNMFRFHVFRQLLTAVITNTMHLPCVNRVRRWISGPRCGCLPHAQVGTSHHSIITQIAEL